MMQCNRLPWILQAGKQTLASIRACSSASKMKRACSEKDDSELIPSKVAKRKNSEPSVDLQDRSQSTPEGSWGGKNKTKRSREIDWSLYGL
jgi:hypothetical protein